MNKVIAKLKLNEISRYLARRAWLRFVKKGNKSETVEIYSRRLDLDTRDLEQKYLASDCIREPENAVIYHALARSHLCTCFVDVGANCGHVAASVLECYQKLVLIEPNPRLASNLRLMFSDEQKVSVVECAIVGKDSVGSITLTVPVDSSGLATLGSTFLSAVHSNNAMYEVKADTLSSVLADNEMGAAYIKIDVEGFELEIFKSASESINKNRPIIGFEALSLLTAKNCISLLERYNFYCARFDFLEGGGALSRSAFGIAQAIFVGSSIEVIKIYDFDSLGLSNFSQVYCVPNEKTEKFEKSIIDHFDRIGHLNVASLRSWS